MLKLQIALTLIVAVALPAFAQQLPTPEQLLDAVHKNADLSAAGPYTLTATVVGNPGNDAKQQTGKLRIDRDHDRFRVELDMPGGYREVRLTLGDNLYVSKGQGTLRATNLVVFDRIWDPLFREPGPLPAKEKIGKLSRKTVQGIEALCFDEKDKSGKTRLCIDPARSVLLSKDEGHYGSTDFSGYTSVSGHLVPGRVEMHKPFVKDLVVQDIAVAFHPVDAARFAIPEHSIELGSCQNMQAPRTVFTPSINYKPPHADKLLVYIIVDSAGKVMDAKVLNGVDAGLAESTRNTISTWTFKPATCAGRPVAAEMMIDMQFHSN